MCGRFSITKNASEIKKRFNVVFDEDLYKIYYNAAPSLTLPVITNNESNKLNFFKWGLVPFWAKDKFIGNKLINARAETLSQKPSFKNLLKTKRCLVIADGFYEWKREGKEKTPYRITLKDEGLFAFAGLWDFWKDNVQDIHSFTIITTIPNNLIKDIHSRMPVILHKEDEEKWLNGSLDNNKILNSYPEEDMKVFKVSGLVNQPQNNTASILESLPENLH